jgi:hypothetical protein
MRMSLLLMVAAVLACSDSSAPSKLQHVATVTIVSGASQTGTAGMNLQQAIVIQAVDSNGHPAVGVSAIFGPSGTGTATPSGTTTDSTGKASTVWMLSTTPGADTLDFAVTDKTDVNDVVQGVVYATGNP